MRTLVVEDNNIKLQRIARALKEVEGFDTVNIEYAHDIVTAKRHLKSTSYDLLVLDINLPTRIEDDASPDAGLKLFEEINSRDVYKVPSHIIGITAYDEVYANAQLRFTDAFTILKFDITDERWIDPFQVRVRQIVMSISNRSFEPAQYRSFMAIICALPDPELSSIRRLPWSWKPESIPGDHTQYYEGHFIRGEDRMRVYAASSPRMGMPTAAVIATKMIYSFRPRYLMMTGIAAGVANRTKMGDVVVADPIWDWGSGKWVVDKGSLKFEQAPYQLNLSPELRSKIELIRQDTLALADIKERWPGEKPSHGLSVHIGPMASGSSVLADGQTIGRIRNQHRGLLGIEMEAYSVFCAAHDSSLPRPKVASLKSVVDFADPEKHDDYQRYASHTSSCVLQLLAESFLD